MRLTLHIAIGLTLTTTLAACGEDHADDPDVEGCAHLQRGPFQQLTAGPTRDSSAPMIDDDHVAYRIGLPGFVFFAPGEAGDYLFFFDGAVDAVFTGPDGAVIAPEATATGSTVCAELRLRHLVELEVGTTFLELSAPDLDQVTIVVEPVAHDHDE